MEKKNKNMETLDGNKAAARVAYAFSEVAAIYPITPASPMGVVVDEWAAKGNKNLFEQPVSVQEMQSEAGAAGTVHGSLSAGAMTSTFTASQGLMLMLPNMFKIAGEMLPCVFHIAARSLACQSLSIFADHSDVMATRGTGFSILASSNVQEAQDMAAIAHLSTVEARVPFLHFFDGFRTSHELQKIEIVDYETLNSMVNWEAVRDFKERALRPEKPYAKVGAEGPDVYFQGREKVNKFYQETPEIVKKYMDLFYQRTGRKYGLYEYTGHTSPEKLIVVMGSAAETVEETVDYLSKKGEKVGVINVKLYRPFSIEDFKEAIPDSVKKIAVLDRTKEPGSIGEPLYLDVVAALKDTEINVIGGRYGLSSKEFTPAMTRAVFEHLDKEGQHEFTVGINDDVTNLSLPVKEEVDTDQKGLLQCKFWGYGSDGTVSSAKNSIKIIGEATDKYVQGYFSYDAKKSGGTTQSFLRISDNLIKSTYKPTHLDIVLLNKPSYVGKYDILSGIKKGGTFLMNTSYSPDQAFYHLTEEMQEIIINRNINFYVIDAFAIAEKNGLGNKISMVMETAFFKLNGLLSEKEAVKYIKEVIEEQFGSIGKEIVDKNKKCVDEALKAVKKAKVPGSVPKKHAEVKKLLPDGAGEFANDIIKPCMVFNGDDIPVSKMSLDGSVPTCTTRLEKRGVAEKVPKWNPQKCVQCGQCAIVCPNAAMRMKQIKPEDLENAPEGFETVKLNVKNDKELRFRVQPFPEDCAGCNVCANACPMGGIEMVPIEEARKNGENEKREFFESLPDNIIEGVEEGTVKGLQFKKPLLEFTGACPGCSEPTYVKILTQLFGDNMIIANATGCSSIWGGTFPTIPFCINDRGEGPAWANSLFEDNAEYGYGFRLAVDATRNELKYYIEKLLESGTTIELRDALSRMLELWERTDEEAKKAAREVKEQIPPALECVYGDSEPLLKKVDELKDYLVNKSVWAVGGDGWAYDIGYGGLDHVIAKGKNINVLVLDTEVYSNTGGQASKATPMGASAQFAADGKETGKKNLGSMMMNYGNVYVASVSIGASRQQLINAMVEAEQYPGPSIIIAYSPCIAHGCDMKNSTTEAKKAVDTGYWPLYRYNPKLAERGGSPLKWDSPVPKESFRDFLMGETRFKKVYLKDSDRAEKLFKGSEKDAKRRFDNVKNGK